MAQYGSAPAATQILSITSAAAEIAAVTAEAGDYTGGGGAEASIAAGVIQAETDITALQGSMTTAEGDIDALEAEVGDYTGGGGAEASIAAGLIAAETNIGTPATVSTETDLFAICAALETRIAALEGA